MENGFFAVKRTDAVVLQICFANSDFLSYFIYMGGNCISKRYTALYLTCTIKNLGDAVRRTGSIAASLVGNASRDAVRFLTCNRHWYSIGNSHV